MNHVAAVMAQVDRLRDALIEDLKTLLRISTVVGNEGPGVDEWMDLESVMQSTKVLAVMTMKWCGVHPER